MAGTRPKLSPRRVLAIGHWLQMQLGLPERGCGQRIFCGAVEALEAEVTPVLEFAWFGQTNPSIELSARLIARGSKFRVGVKAT